MKTDPVKEVRIFFNELEAENELDAGLIIGIDPGASGAIAFVNGRNACSVSIPHNRVKKNKRFSNVPDYDKICQIFDVIEGYHTYAVIILEEIPAGMHADRVYAQTMLNRAWAIWPLFLASKRYKVVDVPPRVWKKDLGLLKKDKEASRMKAKALFPVVRLDRVKDEGRAEALLLTHWFQRFGKK